MAATRIIEACVRTKAKQLSAVGMSGFAARGVTSPSNRSSTRFSGYFR
jgi:hypothetical protein